jgi:cell division septation protein DedD
LTGPPSVKRLLVQVVIVAGLMVGLARWAGRGTGTGSGGVAPPVDPSVATGQAAPGTMSLPGDLTFYKSLGSGKPAPPPTGGLPSDSRTNDDARRPSPPAQAGNGAFVVQALATRDLTAARRLKSRLASRGFPAVVQEDRTETAVVYRVRAARYRTRAEAESAVGVLRRDLHLTAWILQEGD